MPAALVDVLGVPNEDLYQVFAEYIEENFRHTDGYLGLTYSDQLLTIEIYVVMDLPARRMGSHV